LSQEKELRRPFLNIYVMLFVNAKWQSLLEESETGFLIELGFVKSLLDA
jgi:hypothetical protein